MTNLIRDLDEVVRLDKDESFDDDELLYSMMWKFIRQHHDAIRRDAEDARRYRYICENLMTDRDGMFEVQQRIDSITTECYMSKESVNEAVDAAKLPCTPAPEPKVNLGADARESE